MRQDFTDCACLMWLALLYCIRHQWTGVHLLIHLLYLLHQPPQHHPICPLISQGLYRYCSMTGASTTFDPLFWESSGIVFSKLWGERGVVTGVSVGEMAKDYKRTAQHEHVCTVLRTHMHSNMHEHTRTHPDTCTLPQKDRQTRKQVLKANLNKTLLLGLPTHVHPTQQFIVEDFYFLCMNHSYYLLRERVKPGWPTSISSLDKLVIKRSTCSTTFQSL